MAELERAYLCNRVKIAVAQTAWKVTLERFTHVEGVMCVCSLVHANLLSTELHNAFKHTLLN